MRGLVSMISNTEPKLIAHSKFEFFALFRTFTIILLVAMSGCASFDGESVEVSFAGGGGILLQGTLIFPDESSETAPAILLLHGAEPATRDRFIYAMTANIFLERGFIVLVYDKRGAGESEGNYETTTYSQLVEDGVAAIQVLKNHHRVHPDRIGIFGVSESGWLTPEIAERSIGLAFVINKVGSPLSVRETVLWEIYNDTLDAGASEESAAMQADIYRRIFDFRLSPSTEVRIELEELLAVWAEKPDSQLPATINTGTEDENNDLSYDPDPFLRRLSTPFLYALGSEDINIPTRDSVIRLDELIEAGLPVSYRVFEGEGHELGGVSPFPPFYRFARGYAELIADYAQAQVSGN